MNDFFTSQATFNINISEYKIVMSKSEAPSSLTREVNRLLKLGWIPIGGLTQHPVSSELATQVYSQAMIKLSSQPADTKP